MGEFVIIRPPFTIEFVVERNRNAKAQAANIKIYNLGKDTRERIFKDRWEIFQINKPIGPRNYPRTIQFYAGYEGDNSKRMSSVFFGQIVSCSSSRRGPDIITELECNDPGIWNYTTESSHALEAGVDKKEVIQKLYQDMFGEKGAQGYISDTYTGITSRGKVLFGNTYNLLKELTEDGFFVDNGLPIALPLGEAIPGEIKIIDSASGLLNYPIRTEYSITIQILFMPELQLGYNVELNSEMREYNGLYNVYGIRHSGMISGTHDAQTITTVSLFNGEGLPRGS